MTIKGSTVPGPLGRRAADGNARFDGNTTTWKYSGWMAEAGRTVIDNRNPVLGPPNTGGGALMTDDTDAFKLRMLRSLVGGAHELGELPRSCRASNCSMTLA